MFFCPPCDTNGRSVLIRPLSHLRNFDLIVLVSLVKGDVLWSLIVYSMIAEKPAADTEATFCGRPDCDHREAPADEYFVAGIVGRKIIMTGGHGRLSKWLVKWDGQVLFLLIVRMAG